MTRKKEKTAPKGSFSHCLFVEMIMTKSVVAAAAENNYDCEDNNPGAVVVKDVA